MDRQRFDLLVEAEKRNLMAEAADYEHKSRIVSALDAAINHTWGSTNSPVELVERNRFPTVRGSTPDFLFRFSNGYRVVGEYKLNWQNNPRDFNDLRQLKTYKDLEFEPRDTHPEEAGHDVLLLLGNRADEEACEAIRDFPGLGPESVVVTDAVYEERMVNRPTVSFKYRKHGGINGRFREVNAGPAGTEYDLNYWFVEKKGFPARCDEEALLQAGECPFVNDDPPTAYVLAHLLIPILNLLLTDAERDELATSSAVTVSFTIDQLASLAGSRFRRVPLGKLRKWLSSCLVDLVLAELADTHQKEGKQHFMMRLDENQSRFVEDRLYQKFARARIASDAIPVRYSGAQLTFDFDDEVDIN